MQSTIAVVRSVIGDATPYEIDPGLKVSIHVYIYGVLVIENELHVMDVHERWRQVEEWETELIAAVRQHFIMFCNYTELRKKIFWVAVLLCLLMFSCSPRTYQPVIVQHQFSIDELDQVKIDTAGINAMAERDAEQALKRLKKFRK